MGGSFRLHLPGAGTGRACVNSKAIAWRIALGLLAPGAFVFGARAGVTLLGTDPASLPAAAPVTAAGGVLSMLGILLLVAATWRSRGRAPDGRMAQTAAVLVIVGHFAVSTWMPDAGAAMVYLGTGVAAAPVLRSAGWAGAVAGVGALVRTPDGVAGHLAVAAGALVMGVLLAWAASGHAHALFNNR